MIDERTLLAQLPTPVAVIDDRVQVTFANPACARLLAAPATQPGALTRAAASFRTLHEALQRAAKRLRQAGRSATFQWTESPGTFVVRVVRLGPEAGLAVIFEDVSELTKVEEIHVSARQYLERVFHHLDRGVIVLDAAFRVTFFNRFQARLLEAAGMPSPLETIGIPAVAAFPLFDEAEWTALRTVVLRGETVTRERLPFPAGSPQRFLSVTLRPLHDSEREEAGALCLTEDVTGLVELEREIVRRERAALLGHMALSLNHEINDPLTTILGNAETLMHGADLADAHRRRVSAIRTAASRIADVTKQLRNLRDLQLGPMTVDDSTT